jgi:DNA-directed RNA polymerase sigma subunit (sigma70/sigma32)
MTKREKAMLQLRLQGRTLEQIGVEFDVCGARIGQILKKSCGSTFSQFAKSVRESSA